MENNGQKKEYIIRKDLKEQTQILLKAFNSRFDKLEGHITDVKDELRRDINNVQTLIDGYVKAKESFRQEFEVMKAEMKQLKKIIKEKLGLEIRAV